VLRACREAGIICFEKNFSLTQVYSADEAFTTGTFAGLAPVREIDGRRIGDADALPGPMTARLQALYRDLIARDVAVRAGVRLA
jgi:branched-chain amino acid aminotransferase